MATGTEEIRELLQRVPAFETLGEDDLLAVARVAVPRSFGRDQVIFREGDASDTCYIVRTGHCRAIREHPDGRSITLAQFGPGDIFGELAMFDDEVRSATVEAVDADVEAVAILGADMRRLMREHPDISAKLVISLGRRLREANERLARQSFQTVQSRVAVVLSDLVAQARSEGAAGRRRDPADDHAGRHRAARRLIARVREPLPGDARARRRRQAGSRADHRPGSRGARRLRVLMARGPIEREFSAGGVVVREAADGPQCIVIVPTRRAANGSRVLALPKGHPDDGESSRAGGAARGPRGDRASRAASSTTSGRSATGTSVTGARSRRSSPSTSSPTSSGIPRRTSTRRSSRRAGCR